jgi:pantoate--beta-alanine ligase
MKTIENIQRMQTFIKMLKKEGRTIGFVPTMGYLHDGHISLMRAAKTHTDVVAASIFVNPLQFGPSEDFEKYPRDFARDEELAAKAGVDVIFYPRKEDMYPAGYSTYVEVAGMSQVLCGASRPGHFRGVTTVITKLFSIIRPDIAYFGQKDAQQAAIIKKMVEDLNMGIDIKVLPTVREADGLAMSSRNVYLSKTERRDAVVLYESLKKAEEMIRGGARDPKAIIKTIEEMIRASPTSKIDYISIVDAKTLKDVKTIAGEVLVALAVFMGRTRLIDNITVKT